MILIALYIFDVFDIEGLKVTQILLPVRRPPVELFVVLSVLQVMMAPSVVFMVTVFAVEPTIVPVTVEEIELSFMLSVSSPITEEMEIPSRVVPLNSPW